MMLAEKSPRKNSVHQKNFSSFPSIMSNTRDYIFIGNFNPGNGGDKELENFLQTLGCMYIAEKSNHVWQCTGSEMLPDDIYIAYEEFEWQEKPRIVVVNSLYYYENIKMIEEPGVLFDQSLKDWWYE
ncbi:hypothetical protein U2F10_02855 [Leptothoe sp. EHU-05/26/07-4]